MRIFFIQKAVGLFASSGEYRANVSFLKHLASLGHATAQLCFALDGDVECCIAETEAAGRPANLIKDKLRLLSDNDERISIDVSTFTDIHGIHIIALDGNSFREAFPQKLYAKETTDFIEKGVPSAKLREFIHLISSHIDSFKPTHVIFNDSLSLKATSTILHGRDICRVFVIHCAEQLPFGPYSGGLSESACSPKEHDLLREVDGIWAVSRAIRDYAYEHGQLRATFLPHDPWTYLDEQTHQVPREYNNWEKQLVGMVNPSLVKGVTVLRQLAERLPHVNFVVWCSWAFEDSVRTLLEAMPNIELRPTCRNMEEAWEQIKILLVPSLWFEAWGMVVTEAQLRGIPVVSSDSGALRESKLSLPYTIPVNSLTGEHDEEGNYIVPDQNIEPWVKAIEKLQTDKDVYESVSSQARKVTTDWVTGLDGSALEKWLQSLEKR